MEKSLKIANIVENGSSEYKIITSVCPTVAEEYAASEFSNYINKVSGVTLKVVKENTITIDDNSKIISIGKTNALDKCGFNVDYSTFNGDGFILKTKGNALYINGANDRGTLYGVYDFMEKVLGVKFLEIRVEYIPKTNTVPLYQMDEIEIPEFKYRVSLTPSIYIGYDDVNKQLEWAVKERNTSEFLPNDPKYGGTLNINKNVPQVHNNLTYVLQGSSFADFNRAHGGNCERMFFFDGKAEPIDICYTNGINDDGSIDRTTFNTAIAYVEGMKRYISENPNADYYTCGQEDIKNFCHCESCTSVFEKYHGNTTPAIIRFYNAVARDIQAWADKELNGKKINIVIFSYYFSLQAPVMKNDKGEYVPYDSTVLLADNIIVRFADIVTHPAYSFLDEKNEFLGYGPNYLKTWKPIVNKSWYWGYTTSHPYFFGYGGTTRKVQKSLLGLKEINCEYAFMQYNYNEFNDWKTLMDNYACSKMLWNPNQDIHQLRAEFIEYYYGVAAEDVKGIVKILDDNYYHVITLDFYLQLHDAKYFPLSLWEDVLSRIEVAQEKVKAQTDKDADTIAQELIRLERIKLTPLCSMMFSRDEHYKTNEGKNKATMDFFDVCERLGVKWYGEHLSVESLRERFPILD